MSRDVAKGRTIFERAAVRWPGLLPRAARSMLDLSPGSRARRALLRQAAVAAFEAWHRGDFALVPHLDDKAVETRLTLGAGRQPIGLDAIYYGPEGHCRSMEVWNEAWESWDADIEDLVEEGRDRIVVIARIRAIGSASGVRLDEWGAVRYTFRDGRIARVDAAFDPDRQRVLEALGPSAS